MNIAAVILAAGYGRKMWPYGDTHPKATLPVANEPLLKRTLDHLNEIGVKETVVVHGHLAKQVCEIAKSSESVSCIEQKKVTGTADAVARALSVVFSDQVLVLYGDVLVTPEDLKKLIKEHKQHPDSVTLLGSKWDGELPQSGIGIHVRDNIATGLVGHPREDCMMYCGALAFPKTFAEYVERNPGVMKSVEVGVMPPFESELAQSVELYRSEGGAVHVVSAEGPVIDIDKPWHILSANYAWLEHAAKKLGKNEIHPTAEVHVTMDIDGHLVVGEGSYIGPDVKIKGDLWVGKNTRIIDGAILGGKTSIGDNCIIREYCRIGDHSTIGHNCVVGHCAEFEGVLMDGAYSYHYGEYWGVIGRSTDLGAATVCGTLRFDDQETAHRVRGRREIPKIGANASYLGDYVRTGVNAILMPGVKVGPYSLIGPGVLLQEDVPNNSFIYVKQEQGRKEWGPERYGW